MEQERVSDIKHEFFNGEIFAMAGATPQHNIIVTNVLTALSVTLRQRPCRTYASDLKVKCPTGLYTYPDATVSCGELELDADDKNALLNPELIVEVLSSSTEDYDRGKKFVNYRSIPSLKDYVLISQTEVLVEQFARQDDGTWLLRVLRSGDRLDLRGVGCTLDVDELYLKVFEAESGEG